jgi:hypothetical protein
LLAGGVRSGVVEVVEVPPQALGDVGPDVAEVVGGDTSSPSARSRRTSASPRQRLRRWPTWNALCVLGWLYSTITRVPEAAARGVAAGERREDERGGAAEVEVEVDVGPGRDGAGEIERRGRPAAVIGRELRGDLRRALRRALASLKQGKARSPRVGVGWGVEGGLDVGEAVKAAASGQDGVQGAGGCGGERGVGHGGRGG